MQTKLAMFEYLKLQAFIKHFCMIRLRKYIRTLVITRNNQHYHVTPTIFFISNLLLLNHNPLIGKLHNAMSLRNQEYYGHRCCDQKNIRVKDIFFWNEQYLHDNVGCCE
jgi:hypothetical protein